MTRRCDCLLIRLCTYLRCRQEKFVQVVVWPGAQRKCNITCKENYCKVIKRMITNCETGNLRRVIRYSAPSIAKESGGTIIVVSHVVLGSMHSHSVHRTSLLSSLQRSPAITANYRLFGVHWWKISVNISAFRPLKKAIFSHTQQNRRVLSNKAFP